MQAKRILYVDKNNLCISKLRQFIDKKRRIIDGGSRAKARQNHEKHRGGGVRGGGRVAPRPDYKTQTPIGGYLLEPDAIAAGGGMEL